MCDSCRMSDDQLWASLTSAEDSRRGDVLQMLAWRAIRTEKWGEAVALLEEAKSVFERLGKSTDARMCEHWMARCATNMGDTDGATARHQKVLDAIAADGPLDQLGAKTADAIGCQLRDSGRQREAVDYFSLAARAHEANADLELAADSAAKWLIQVRDAGLWHQMRDASALMLRVSTDVESHMLAHIGTVLAACAQQDHSVDVEALVRKCERLAVACDDMETFHELHLARIAVARLRGDDEEALSIARMGKDAAHATSGTSHQVRFIIAEAECLLEREPERAEELLLTAHDVAEVLRRPELLDRVAMVLMHIREARCEPDELPFAV